MAIDIGTAVAYLNLDSTNFNSGITAAESALQQFQNQGGGVVNALGAVGQTMTNIGYDMTKKLTVPLANFGQTAIQNFRDYESAFAGVKKTIDEADLSKYNVTYDQLSEAIQKMATETASSAEEIAGVMEMAGQLGIPLGEAGEDITKFTKTMVMLGDSTNLSADEAALALAKFMNITGTAAEDSDRLGSAVVDLGNKFATQEDQIVNMSTRLASAGTIAGLTEQEILALATSMSSAGIRAEAGGSAMATTLTQIEKIVMGVAENSEQKLKELGDVSGMTAEEFATAWKNDPITALTAFLHGLGGLEDQGESAVVVLDDLGMTGVRQANMLKALALSAENMDYALQVSNNAWKENTALVTEADKRYETLDSRLSQLNEKWKIMKRDIAEMLIPVLERLMEVASKLMDKWKGLSDSQKQTALRIAEIVAAVGPALVIFGKLFTTIQKLHTIFGILGGLLEGVAIGPIAAIVAGVALLVAGFVKAYKESESFRETVGRLFEELGRIFSMVIEYVKGIWEAVKPVLDIVIQIISELLQILLPPLVDLLHAILDAIEPLIPIATTLAKIIGQVLTAALQVIRPILEAIIGIIALLIEGIAAIIEVIASIVKVVSEAVTFILNKVVGFFETVIGKIQEWSDFVFGNIRDVIEAVSEFVQKIFGFFEWLWDVLFGHSIIPDICNAFIKWFTETFEKVIGIITEFIRNAIEKFNEFKDKVLEVIQQIKDYIQQKFEELKEIIIEKFQQLKDNIQQKFEELKENVVNKVNEMKEAFVNKVEEMKNNAINKFNELKQNITSKMEEIKETTKRKFEELKNQATESMQRLKEKIAEVVEDIKGKFENLYNTLSDVVSKFWDIGASLVNNIWEGLQSAWGNVADWFMGKLSWVHEMMSNMWSSVSSFAGSVGGFFNGSHANGLDYVPFDGYIAQLHQGERVLTKEENEEYNNGGSNTQGGDTYNFYNTEPDPYEYARQMKRVKKELAYT